MSQLNQVLFQFCMRLASSIMSTTATSMAPSPSSFDPALRPARSAIPQNVSTPKAPQQPTTPTPSPGTFRHPRTTEILARNSATTLTDGDIRRALTNVGALVLSVVFSNVVHSSLTPILTASGLADAAQLSSTILLLFRLVICANIVLLLRPVIPYISKKDEIPDIPLTPSQRSLLGLKPSAQASPSPAVSAGSFVTPPRYRRSSGSFSGSASSAQNGTGYGTDRRSISANYSSSPLSTSRFTVGFSPTPSQSIQRNPQGSPFSPSPSASPLFHKAMSQNQTQSQSQLASLTFSDIDLSASTRSSFGASIGASGLGRSQSLRERSRRESLEPASPTGAGRSPQVVPGLNYKWLYDKGRRLPKSDSYGF